jgi:hypothetical protein
VQGIAWWEERIAAIEHGADAVGEGRMLTVSLDELVRLQRARAGLRPLFRFLGVPVTKRTRRYFSNRMTTDQANKERWREGISASRAERVDRLYREALERLDAAGARSRRCSATRSNAATTTSTRWSTSTIEGQSHE